MASRKKEHKRFTWLKPSARKISEKLQKLPNRANAAHFMMVLFVSFNAVGAWLIAPQYGLITAGICSGIYGYLLGNE
jgi:hypothetical protein